MNKRIFGSIGLALILAGSPGCALLKNPTTAQRAATAAKVASYVGSAEHLRSHPEARPAWVAARDALWQLESAETIDFVILLAIVHQLPITELKSARATLIVTAATILVTDYAGTIPADEVNKLRPLVTAIRSGIDLGLGTNP